jgi:hypothetical protein
MLWHAPILQHSPRFRITPFLNTERVTETRVETRQAPEPTNEPSDSGTLFFISTLVRPIVPEQTWFGPV